MRRLVRIGLVVGLSIGSLLGLVGCPPPRGGWDVERVLREEPGLAELGARGLGDLVPYPAPMRGSDAADSPPVVRLIACRWPTGSRIPVRLRLDAARADWARHAIASLSEGLAGIDLVVAASLDAAAPSSRDAAQPSSEGFRGIDVVAFGTDREDGPSGVGDTLVGCPVSASEPERPGSLRHAEIRMRARSVDALDRSQPIAAADWTGALMHELAHALGFQGHVRSGDSVLVLEQDRLRRAGRQALAGKVWHDEVLEALYRLEVGRELGERALSPATGYWLRELEARDDSMERAVVAWVGDRQAELRWTTDAGVALPLRFPDWPRQLRSGLPLRAIAIGAAGRAP
jgi:hypothetical protein